MTPTFHFRILEDSISGMNKSIKLLVEKLETQAGKTVIISDYITNCTLDVMGGNSISFTYTHIINVII